jgi:hypothetical protein
MQQQQSSFSIYSECSSPLDDPKPKKLNLFIFLNRMTQNREKLRFLSKHFVIESFSK